MSFCLYELAKNMDVQVRLRSEMGSVLSQHGGNITYEAVSEMKYLDAVISGEGYTFLLKDVGKCKVFPVLN
jgi:cytochrome P450 family 6